MRAAWLGLLFFATTVAAVPQSDLAEDRKLLDHLARRAFDDPAGMQAELAQRWPSGATPAREAAWLFARGRVQLAAGLAGAADATAVQLMSTEDGADRSWLLRALIQERAGKPAGALAARALAGLEKHCPAGDEARAVRELACDFRATWEAVRLQLREQSGQGAFVDAEASARRALALARAGGDKYLVALSLGHLASALQLLDQPDAARAQLRAAQAEAQGDPVAGARVRHVEGFMARRMRDAAAVRSALEAGLQLAEQADAPHLAAQMRSNLVDAYMHLGLLQEALASGERALPVLQRFHDRPAERSLHHNLAVAHIKLHQFDAARRELARAAALPRDPAVLVPRARELRELGDSWAEAGQHREALAAFHGERELSERANERSRAAALEELRRKYDTVARQRDLDLLARDGQLKDQQLENGRLARRVGIAIGALLLLSVALIGVTLLRMRRAHARLTANQHLLRAQSERDPLTDLSNRRHFLAVMDARARQAGVAGLRGALLMIDLDHFKNVNDAHGHAAGDAVLVEVSRRIRAAVRDGDLVVRWGGEEFLVFAPELAGSDLAHLTERVLQGIGRVPVATPDGALRIAASVGFASFPLRGPAAPGEALSLHWEQAVNWVDMALYKAKVEGRNRGVGIEGVQAVDADTVAAILQDFDAACLQGQVRLQLLVGPA